MKYSLDHDRAYCEEFDPYETGERLRRNRKALSLSLFGLADCLSAMGYEISVNSLGAWERGEKAPSLGHLIMLAHFYGRTLDELVACRHRLRDEGDRDQLVPYLKAIRLQEFKADVRMAYICFFYTRRAAKNFVEKRNNSHFVNFSWSRKGQILFIMWPYQAREITNWKRPERAVPRKPVLPF